MSASPLTPPLAVVGFDLPANHSSIHWLDPSLPYVQAFQSAYGWNLVTNPEQTSSYYITIAARTYAALQQATPKLHRQFIEATRYVLKHPELWPSYGFPEAFWPRAIESFERGDKTVSGRMDFSISDDGSLKCFEYNADSASCLLECGLSQGAWMTAAGQGGSGVDAGVGLFEMMVHAWQRLGLPAGSAVHFLHDGETDEEKYHTLYMMSAAEIAGLVCKRYASVEGFSFNAGCPVDTDGVPVTHIWKTWAYATLLDRWQGNALRTEGDFGVHDVILNPNVRVFEPLWTAVAGNKAILPILTQLYPEDPHLLFTSPSLTPDLLKNGFAAKPTQGRCGENVSIHRPEVGSDGQSRDAVAAELQGRFGNNELVYQELAVLPKINGLHVQINSFVVGESFAGLVTRVDASAIMNVESECTSLRVVDDGSGSALPSVQSVMAAKSF